MKKQNIDKLLSASALQQAHLLDDSLPAEDDLSKFSPPNKLDSRIQDLLAKTEKRRATRKKRFVKYIVSATASILILAGIFTFTSYANGTNLFQIFERGAFSINYTEKERGADFNSKILNDVTNVYLPTWLPNDFTAEFSTQNKANCIIKYISQKDKRHFLSISQKKSTVKTLDDSEIADFKKIIRNNHVYYFGGKVRSGFIENNLVFIRNGRYFLFTSTLAQDDLIKIAESLILKK